MKIFGRSGRALAGVAVSVALLLAGTGVANAGVRQFQDGFEGNPGATWRTATNGSGNAGFDVNIGNARTGQNNGWLHSGYSQGSAAAEDVTVSTGSSGTSDCVAQVYVNPLNNRSTGITVAVYDTAGNRLSTVNRGLTFTGYQAVQSNHFALSGYRTVVVRLLVIDSGRGADGEWLRLDDFTLSCFY